MQNSKSITSDLIANLHRWNLMLLSSEDVNDYKAILVDVAENAKEFLGADLVDFYEYSQSEDKFILPPVLVGARANPYVTKTKIHEDDAIVRLVKEKSTLYLANAQEVETFNQMYTIERADVPPQRFVVREKIQSCASIPLIARNEILGVLFVNYRYHQSFEEEQRNAIELFASFAALAILNSRIVKKRERKKDIIFISYTHQDSNRVLPIYQKLIEKGYNAWLDIQELLPGQDWDYEIQNVIKNSRIFIACLSNKSVNKKGYFQKELKRGLEIYGEFPKGSIYLIPLILEECKVPSDFEKIQWRKIENDNDFQKLFEAIESGLNG